MVDPEAFEEARALLNEEIRNAYEGRFLVPPVEIAPGYWVMWPTRVISVSLEEAYLWQYGVPIHPTGRLQIKVNKHYSGATRISPKKGEPLSRKEARKAAREALEASQGWAMHYDDDSLDYQRAYIDGYDFVRGLPEEELEHLWSIRELHFRDRERFPDWAPFWEALNYRTLLEPPKGPFTWVPDFQKSPYSELGKERERYARGGMDAVDDWARGRGLLRYEEVPGSRRWVVQG
jgi:hypothetical protein